MSVTQLTSLGKTQASNLIDMLNFRDRDLAMFCNKNLYMQARRENFIKRDKKNREQFRSSDSFSHARTQS